MDVRLALAQSSAQDFDGPFPAINGGFVVPPTIRGVVPNSIVLVFPTKGRGMGVHNSSSRVFPLGNGSP